MNNTNPLYEAYSMVDPSKNKGHVKPKAKPSVQQEQEPKWPVGVSTGTPEYSKFINKWLAYKNRTPPTKGAYNVAPIKRFSLSQ